MEQVDLERVRQVAATPPIFIGGSVRSGTTLVQSLIDAHPEVHICYETGFAVDLLLAPDAHGLQPSTVIDRVIAHPGYRTLDLPFAPEQLRSLMLELEPRHPTDVVRSLLALRAVIEGKCRYGDKTPRYVFHFKQLSEIFPDSRLVLVLRDGRHAAASSARVTQFMVVPRSVLIEALVWRSAARRAVQARRTLPRGQLLTVRLEDLIADKELTARRLCEHVGVPFNEAVLVPHRDARERLPMDDREFETLHPNLSAPIGASSRDWTQDLSAGDTRAVEVVLSSTMRLVGYHVETRYSMSERASGWGRAGIAVARELPRNFGRLKNQARRDLSTVLRRLRRS